MEFKEKVSKLVGTQNKSELSRRAGLPETALDALVNKGREPLARNAVKLSKVLNVPCDWLFDDTADWPPPAKLGAGDLTQRELVEEVARRSELIRKDMRAISAQFPLERLVHLDRVSGFGPKNDAQRLELDAALSLLFRLEMLGRQLSWLSADEVHPPEACQDADQLLEPFPRLYGELAALLHKNIATSLGKPGMFRISGAEKRAVPRFDLTSEGTFPKANSAPHGETDVDSTTTTPAELARSKAKKNAEAKAYSKARHRGHSSPPRNRK